MSSMLSELVSNARRLVKDGYYDQLPHDRIQAPPLAASLLSSKRFPLVAEVKLASPSWGRISAHSARDLVKYYVEGGASAISVVTEPRWFGGELHMLTEAVRSSLPVLMKDFVVEERQVEAAYRHGASAVLLIEEAFEGRSAATERESLVEYAHALGLEVLLEAGCERSLRQALKSDADLIGLNQRDLASMTVDTEKGRRMLRLVENENRPVVVMSGIVSRRQVEDLRDAGADAALVGTAASSSADPSSFIGSLEVDR